MNDERKCIVCGEMFVPRHGNQRCCSSACITQRRTDLGFIRRGEIRALYIIPEVVRAAEAEARKRAAALAARDAAYRREYGHACGRARGRLARPLTPVETQPFNQANCKPLFEIKRRRADVAR